MQVNRLRRQRKLDVGRGVSFDIGQAHHRQLLAAQLELRTWSSARARHELTADSQSTGANLRLAAQREATVERTVGVDFKRRQSRAEAWQQQATRQQPQFAAKHGRVAHAAQLGIKVHAAFAAGQVRYKFFQPTDVRHVGQQFATQWRVGAQASVKRALQADPFTETELGSSAQTFAIERKRRLRITQRQVLIGVTGGAIAHAAALDLCKALAMPQAGLDAERRVSAEAAARQQGARQPRTCQGQRQRAQMQFRATVTRTPVRHRHTQLGAVLRDTGRPQREFALREGQRRGAL